MRSLISHGPITTWSNVLVPIATTNGGRRGAKAPPPRWCCVARSSCSPPLPLGCASLRPGSWRLRRSGPGNLFVMTWTHAATGAPSSDAFAVILLRILQTLRLPYLSSVCHRSFFYQAFDGCGADALGSCLLNEMDNLAAIARML